MVNSISHNDTTEWTLISWMSPAMLAEPDQPTHTQITSDREIALLFDEGLSDCDYHIFRTAMDALWQWAFNIVTAAIPDPDAAQDITQDAMIEVYRVAQKQQLSGEQMVGLTLAKLKGWKGVPGLIAKHRAEVAGRHRLEISLDAPLRRKEDVSETTLEDVISISLETLEDSSTEIHEWQRQTYLHDIDLKIAAWKAHLANITKPTEQQTLTALLDYVEMGRATIDETSDDIIDFKIVLGRFKRAWLVSPQAETWFKTALNLKRTTAVRDRLWRVRDMLKQHGLDVPTIKRGHLAHATQALTDEATWLWDVPTDRQTMRALCRWFQHYLDKAQADNVELPPLLIQKQSQFVLDKTLSEHLQKQLGLRQNTVRKRVDRILDLLAEWDLVEELKDE